MSFNTPKISFLLVDVESSSKDISKEGEDILTGNGLIDAKKAFDILTGNE